MTDSTSSGSSEPIVFGEVEFSEHEAAEAFHKIASRFYERNFGAASKTEIELIMFGILVEKAPELSDLALAKRLGITPQMVSNRRTKLALRNDLESCDWAESLLKVLDSGTYVLRETKSGCEMKIMFPSKMAVYEFEDALRGCGHYFDNSFNSLVVVAPMSAIFHLLFEEIAGLPMPMGCESPGPGGYVKYCLGKKKIEEPQVREAVEKLWGQEALEKTTALGKGVARTAFSAVLKGLMVDQVVDCARALCSMVSNYMKDGGPSDEKRDDAGSVEKADASPSLGRLKFIEGIAKHLSSREKLVIENDTPVETTLKEKGKKGR